MSYTEHNTQAACVRWFRLTHPSLAPLLFAVPNGARRSRWEAAQAKSEGLVAGVSDLILLHPSGDYHGLCIELKKEVEEWHLGKRTMTRGYQSPSQREWQAAVESKGYRYEIIRTADEFINLITEYLK